MEMHLGEFQSSQSQNSISQAGVEYRGSVPVGTGSKPSSSASQTIVVNMWQLTLQYLQEFFL